jgi:hypothetical protein
MVDFGCVSGCGGNTKCRLEDRSYRMWYIWSIKKKRQKIKNKAKVKKRKKQGTAKVVAKIVGYQPFQGGTLCCLRDLPKTRPTHPLCSC